MKRGAEAYLDARIANAVIGIRDACRRRPLVAYGLSGALVLVSIAITIAVGRPNYTPFLAFYPSLILTALLCGRGPAYCAAAATLFYAWFCYLSPAFSFELDSGNRAALLLFGIVSLVVVESVLWFGQLSERIRTAFSQVEDRERRLASSLAELQAMYAQAPVGLALLDRDLRFVRINESLAQTNGHSVEEHIGRTAWDLLPDLKESAEAPLLEVIRTGKALRNVEIHGETAASPGVIRHWVETFYPVSLPDGQATGIGVICEEVTELRQSQERERLLVREVEHRAKNLLAIVQSVVRLTRSDSAAGYREALLGRIQALARAHDLQADRWSGLALEELLLAEVAPFHESVSVRGCDQPLLLPREVAQSLSLALHELATNCAKYGAFSRGGRVAIDWDAGPHEAGQHIVITWQESGGPPVAAPIRTGFGSRLLRGTISNLPGGELVQEFLPDGLLCRMSFVLTP